MLLPPIVAVLALGALVAYYPSIEPASEAYDQALVDVGVSLGAYIRSAGSGYRFDLPPPVEQMLRRDRADTLYYRVISPGGQEIGGDESLPGPPPELATSEGLASYDAVFRGAPVRVVSVEAPCGRSTCTVLVAETTAKRSRLAREILVGSLFPELLIAAATLVIVWFGVKRGLAPLARLSEEIKARSPVDLRPIEAGGPEETQPLVAALNGLLAEVAQASRSQQRFLADAAHQLRTPLAGLQAHTELALAQPLPPDSRAQLEQVHAATVRTARLANQLLALARAEPGARREAAALDLKAMAGAEADDWVRQSLARDIDLGFELEPAPVLGDAFLLREAIGNLVHNALQYAPRGGHVTVRTGKRGAQSFVEVEDDGPGIPDGERGRALERFYRLPGTPGTGSGLGLAIVRDIAAGHGASLELGEGSPEGGPSAARGLRVAITFPHG